MQKDGILGLGKLGVRFFAWTQLKELDLIKTGEVALAFGITKNCEAKLFSRLTRSKLILRLTKGIYLVPRNLPPGGKWGPNPLWVLARLMKFYKAKYQITGFSAFHKYGFITQVPNNFTVYNTRISATKKIGGITYDFIKVSKVRSGSINLIDIPEGEKLAFSTSARSLLDAFYDWSRFGTLPKAFDWIEENINDKQLMKEFIKVTAKYGDIATCRRVGYFLTSKGFSKEKLRSLKSKAKKTSSFIPLIPNKTKRGKVNYEWGLIING
jgi:predicted transcriptional regulator of viral defense system